MDRRRVLLPFLCVCEVPLAVLVRSCGGGWLAHMQSLSSHRRHETIQLFGSAPQPELPAPSYCSASGAAGALHSGAAEPHGGGDHSINRRNKLLLLAFAHFARANTLKKKKMTLGRSQI